MEEYQIEQRIQIDFSNTGVPPRVFAKKYDSNMRVVAVDLYNSGQPYTVPPGYSVNIRLDKRDGHHVYNPALFGTGNTVFVLLTRQMLTHPGELLAELEVVQGGNALKTATFVIACAPSVFPDDQIQSTDEYKTIQEIYELAKDAAGFVEENIKTIKDIPKQIEDMKGLVEKSETAAAAASDSAEAAAAIRDDAKDAVNAAIDSATQAKSYAVGGTGTRENEDTENAAYYYDQTKRIAGGVEGGLTPMGSVSFESLKTIDKLPGFMYNITDAFDTDETFIEGPGHHYEAGANVYWTGNGQWDVLAAPGVTGIKGAGEQLFRTGNVTLTAENVGAYTKEQVDKKIDAHKTRSWGPTTVFAEGWVSITPEESEEVYEDEHEEDPELEPEPELEPGDETYAGVNCQYKNEIVCEGMTSDMPAARLLVSYAGGDLASMQTWHHFVIADGVLTLWSETPPGNDFLVIIVEV